MKRVALGAALACLAPCAFAEVYFNYCLPNGGIWSDIGPVRYQDFRRQGKFFSTSDYGFVPGGDYALSAAKLGLKWSKDEPFVRGQLPSSAAKLDATFHPWLSDGADCVFGLDFEEPFKPTWAFSPEKQFERMEGGIPRFNRAIVHWGRSVPKPGTWGAGVLDSKGKLVKGEFDRKAVVHPYDRTIVSFPATTVRKLFVAVKGGERNDNFVEVNELSLLVDCPPFIDRDVMVYARNAYRALYSSKNPGDIARLEVENFYFNKRFGSPCLLKDLAPFVELDGKRLRVSKAVGKAEASKDGDADVLRYQLAFELPGGKPLSLDVKAVFSRELEDSVTFSFKAPELPAGAALGFSMNGGSDVFGNFLDGSAPVELSPKLQRFATPAGPFAIKLERAARLVCAQGANASDVRMDAIAKGSELEVALSLPIGPDAGVQPSMVKYNWRDSLAGDGEEGLAPFKSSDLELVDSVDLGDPNESRKIYDLVNDPIIEKWRSGGSGKLPGSFCLKNLDAPEKNAVPVATVLGQKCREIGKGECSYFRFNFNCDIYPQTPYLLVVEHAFDKERRGEFHSLAVSKSGDSIVSDLSFWDSPCPYGGFDTGKGPFDGKFKKESVFLMRYMTTGSSAGSTVSLCFTNMPPNNYFRNLSETASGLAIKSVKLYRVVKMPELPDVEKLLPEGVKRHVTFHGENATPWNLSQLPRLYGNDGVWTHRQDVAQYLYGGADHGDACLAGWASWSCSGSLQGNRWLYEKAAKEKMNVNMCLDWIFELGSEGTANCGSFAGVGWLPYGGVAWRNIYEAIPLSPNAEERAFIDRTLERVLAALAKNPSFKDIAIDSSVPFTKRNFDDFSRETGVAFASSPAPIENMKRLSEAPKETVEAWMKWSCAKRHELLARILRKARSWRSDIYITLNQSWYYNGLQLAYYSDGWPLDVSAFKGKGVESYYDFLRLTGTDPELYSKDDGFVFGVDLESKCCKGDEANWPWGGVGERIRDSFGGGLSVSSGAFDEGPKPMGGWTCNCVIPQREFRREFINALVQANAREFTYQTYAQDPVRGRLGDFRQLVVPFRLLPFAKPEPFAGKVSDTAKQALVKRYGDRYALVNYGDKPTVAALSLPEGAKEAFDLSNGVRQRLLVSPERTVSFNLEPWSLKTLEFK